MWTTKEAHWPLFWLKSKLRSKLRSKQRLFTAKAESLAMATERTLVDLIWSVLLWATPARTNALVLLVLLRNQE